MKFFQICWTSAALVWCFASHVLAAQCSDGIVKLRGDWGAVTFRVEVADTKASRARGLMHREHLAAQSGMLFLYPAPQSVSFWMRNTLIPLDMLFIDQAGLVSMIYHRAEPHDEKLIYGGNEVLSVLEINGGMATELGITVGSEVQSPLLPQKSAAWPCS